MHFGDDSHASGSSVGLLDYVGYNSIVNNKYNDGCCVHVRSIEVNQCCQIHRYGMSLHLLFVVLKLPGHGVDSSASPHLVAKVVAVARFIENNCTPPNKCKLGLCWI